MSEVSERSMTVLRWMRDCELDPFKRSCFLSGHTLAAQARKDGIITHDRDLEDAVNELLHAGYIGAQISRSDQ